MKEKKRLINDKYYIASELDRELESLISAAMICKQNLNANKMVRLRESNLIQKSARVALLIEKLSVLEYILNEEK